MVVAVGAARYVNSSMYLCKCPSLIHLQTTAYKTYRRGTSTGVSVWTMLIWTSAGVFMGVYNIGLGVAIALWIQPQIFTFIACICLFQEFRYQHKWPLKKTCIGFVSSCLFFSGLEIGLVFAFKVSNRGIINSDTVKS